MGLPFSRDVTIVPGGEIPSALINKLQDGEVDAKHGTVTDSISPHAVKSPSGTLTTPSSGTPNQWSGATDYYYPLAVRAGDVITAWSVYGDDQAAGAFTVSLRRITADGTGGAVGGSFVSSLNLGGFREVGEALAVPQLVAVAEAYSIWVQANVGHRFTLGTYSRHRP